MAKEKRDALDCCFPPLFFEKGLSLNLKFVSLARLAGQELLSIPLLPHTASHQHRGYKCAINASIFYTWMLTIYTQVLTARQEALYQLRYLPGSQKLVF